MKYFDVFKNKLDKIKATKKYANEKNVSYSWYQGLFLSIAFLFAVGTLIIFPIVIATDYMLALANIKGTWIESFFADILNIGVIVIPIIFVFIMIDKAIMIYIKTLDKFNQMVFKGWQKLDMYYFRKYRRHSPLTEGFTKINDKIAKRASKLSKNQKKIIKFVLIALLIITNIYWKAPIFMELLNDTNKKDIPPPESDSQTKENAPEIKININKGG